MSRLSDLEREVRYLRMMQVSQMQFDALLEHLGMEMTHGPYWVVVKKEDTDDKDN